jgi:hypothetical protein
VEADIMWRRSLAVVIVCMAQISAAATSGGQTHCQLVDNESRFYVQHAIDGAMHRLDAPECQRVFTDFADPIGRSLRATLDGDGIDGAGFLANLRFVEAGNTDQCLKQPELMAFTAPGFRVIHVCGRHFARRFKGSSKGAEMIIIHETLHAIGLGENPPASEDITAQVTRRCGV